MMHTSLLLYIWQNLLMISLHAGSRKWELHQHISETIPRHKDIMVYVHEGRQRRQGDIQKRETSMTAFLCDFFSYILTSFSHGSRAEIASSPQSPQKERKGISDKDTTSQEETTTSTSDHLASQSSCNIGASQYHHHYNDRCTSCDQGILATCLHFYDVDIKDG